MEPHNEVRLALQRRKQNNAIAAGSRDIFSHNALSLDASGAERQDTSGANACRGAKKLVVLTGNIRSASRNSEHLREALRGCDVAILQERLIVNSDIMTDSSLDWFKSEEVGWSNRTAVAVFKAHNAVCTYAEKEHCAC